MRLERLNDHHELTQFSCGAAELDDWLRRHALASQRMDSARTFVAVDRDGAVCGYFSLTMGSVAKAAAPSTLVRGLPNSPVSAVIVARLAVSATRQGSGLGAQLLAEALRLAVAAGETVAARLVIVDALDETAAKFSQRFGFVALPEHPLRLYRRIKDIRASLSAAQPDPRS